MALEAMEGQTVQREGTLNRGNQELTNKKRAERKKKASGAPKREKKEKTSHQNSSYFLSASESLIPDTHVTSFAAHLTLHLSFSKSTLLPIMEDQKKSDAIAEGRRIYLGT